MTVPQRVYALTRAAGDDLYAHGLTPTAVQSGAYAALPGDLVRVDSSGGAINIALPTGAPDKSRIVVKQAAAALPVSTVTVLCSGTDTFNRPGGVTSATLPLLGQSMQFQYLASAGIWIVTANDLPLSQLDLRFGSGGGTVVTKTGAYAMVSTDTFVLATGTFTVTLPAVASAVVGKRYTVKNMSTGTVTIAPASGTIDGAASVVLTTQYGSRDFVTDGTNWMVV